jgi:hypothetical protein
MGARGARMEKLTDLRKNYKGLKLCDRLVIEHRQSETDVDGGSAVGGSASTKSVDMDTMKRQGGNGEMMCEFRMLFDETKALRDDEEGGEQWQTTCATRGIG